LSIAICCRILGLDGVTIRLVRIYRRQPNSPAVRVRLDSISHSAERGQVHDKLGREACPRVRVVARASRGGISIDLAADYWGCAEAQSQPAHSMTARCAGIAQLYVEAGAVERLCCPEPVQALRRQYSYHTISAPHYRVLPGRAETIAVAEVDGTLAHRPRAVVVDETHPQSPLHKRCALQEGCKNYIRLEANGCDRYQGISRISQADRPDVCTQVTAGEEYDRDQEGAGRRIDPIDCYSVGLPLDEVGRPVYYVVCRPVIDSQDTVGGRVLLHLLVHVGRGVLLFVSLRPFIRAIRSPHVPARAVRRCTIRHGARGNEQGRLGGQPAKVGRGDGLVAGAGRRGNSGYCDSYAHL